MDTRTKITLALLVLVSIIGIGWARILYQVDHGDPAVCKLVCGVIDHSTQIVDGKCFCVKEGK